MLSLYKHLKDGQGPRDLREKAEDCLSILKDLYGREAEEPEKASALMSTVCMLEELTPILMTVQSTTSTKG